MGALTTFLAGALILVYMAPMWEEERRRLIWHAGVALALLGYIVVSSGFELGTDRLFFAGMAGAWLFGVLCHWTGLIARSKGWSVGRWRVPEVAGGIIVAIPLIVTLVGLVSPQTA